MGIASQRVRTLLTALLVVAAVWLTASPAQAAGYRYWSFWGRDADSWTFAQNGPATTRPSDGDVEGWRFAVSADSAGAQKPRGDAEFTKICANTEAKEGQKRVALVLDFGTRADAPNGDTPPPAHTACAQVPADATAADSLAAVAKPLRYSSAGLVCAITGYPQSGCGEQTASGGAAVPSASAAPKAKRADGGPSLGLFAGVAAVVAVGAAAVWQSRRRRAR